MTRVRAFIRGSGGDAFIVALFVAAELEAWLTVEGWEWPVSLFAALSTLPLLLRRRSAFAAAAASGCQPGSRGVCGSVRSSSPSTCSALNTTYARATTCST